jgi:hypothetical protein
LRDGKDQDILSCHSGLLLVAAHFHIYSYVEVNLRGDKNVEKIGQPLLRRILTDSLCQDRAFYLAKFLLNKGCRLDCELGSGMQWEYLLAHIFQSLYHWQKCKEGICHKSLLHPAWSYGRVVLLLLEFGADVNQRVDTGKSILWTTYGNIIKTPTTFPFPTRPSYKCSALHIMLMKRVCPIYEPLLPVLQVFLDRGTDVTAVDSNGCSVIQIAEKNWPQAVDLLKSYSPVPRS